MDNIKILHFIVVVLVGWVNRHQQAIIYDDMPGTVDQRIIN